MLNLNIQNLTFNLDNYSMFDRNYCAMHFMSWPPILGYATGHDTTWSPERGSRREPSIEVQTFLSVFPGITSPHKSLLLSISPCVQYVSSFQMSWSNLLCMHWFKTGVITVLHKRLYIEYHRCCNWGDGFLWILKDHSLSHCIFFKDPPLV